QLAFLALAPRALARELARIERPSADVEDLEAPPVLAHRRTDDVFGCLEPKQVRRRLVRVDDPPVGGLERDAFADPAENRLEVLPGQRSLQTRAFDDASCRDLVHGPPDRSWASGSLAATPRVVHRGPRDSSSTRENARVTRPAPAAAVPLVLVPALGLAQGGFSPDAWVWAGALAAWAAALAVVVGADAGALQDAWPWLGCAGALLGWTLASALWSAHTTQTVLDARRTLCYVVVLLALVALARRGAERL